MFSAFLLMLRVELEGLYPRSFCFPIYCVNTNVGRTVFLNTAWIYNCITGVKVCSIYIQVWVLVCIKVVKVTLIFLLVNINLVLKIFHNIYKKVTSPRCASAVTSLCWCSGWFASTTGPICFQSIYSISVSYVKYVNKKWPNSLSLQYFLQPGQRWEESRILCIGL